jgi:putative ABC transport system permease protein
LGATVPGIIILFSKDFVKLVALATLIAVPLIYFLADRWLMNYAFHTSPRWFIFLLPPLLLLFITLVTVALQGTRTAIANPVRSLRSE